MLFGKPKRTLTRLLIVEDEPLVAFDTEHFLGEAGYEVVATVDRVADATVHLSDGSDVHVVLVDVNLADGNGLEVARLAASRNVPVLFVTGSCPVEAEEIAHGCLAKPYPQKSLLRAIEAIDQVVQGTRPKKLPPGFRLFREPAAADAA